MNKILNNYEIHTQRCLANHGWLISQHSFSFGNYYNPKETGFSDLLVINEDKVKENKGFSPHSHKNMEIFSYVLSGSLEHKDSLGNTEKIMPNDVQLMSAGSGVNHSEYNPSLTEPVHFLQIWIKPNIFNTKPRYQQKNFSDNDKRGKLQLILSENGENNSLQIKQDIMIYAGLFDKDESALLPVKKDRYQYVFAVAGSIKINDVVVNAGEGLKIRTNNETLYFNQGKAAHILVFDMKKEED